MDTVSLSELVERSLAGPREVFIPSGVEASAYVDGILSRFLSGRIAPDSRSVQVRSHIVHLVGLPEGEHTVYFVTDDDPQSVFYDPHSGSFGCAWGPDAESGRYVDLGFRSFDVLAMAAA
jgi:hypothetical protein